MTSWTKTKQELVASPKSPQEKIADLSWQEQRESAVLKIQLLNTFVKEAEHVHRLIQRKCCIRWKENTFDAKRPLPDTIQGFCYDICETPSFENFILFCIGMNCVVLAAFDPLDDGGSTRSRILFWTEFVLLMIFTLEITIKIVAWGVFRDRHSYLR